MGCAHALLPRVSHLLLIFTVRKLCLASPCLHISNYNTQLFKMTNISARGLLPNLQQDISFFLMFFCYTVTYHIHGRATQCGSHFCSNYEPGKPKVSCNRNKMIKQCEDKQVIKYMASSILYIYDIKHVT